MDRKVRTAESRDIPRITEIYNGLMDGKYGDVTIMEKLLAER